jgi:GntR family transcriptional regulator, transcriptional repressor for pyruvate dehydrogenase complex
MSVVGPISTKASGVHFQAIPRNATKIYEAVAEQMERRVREEMKPGDLLPPERELVQMFGVSRSSIRDAIRSLELLGLVEPKQGVGTIVREATVEPPANPIAGVLWQKRKMIGELLDVRKLIEPPLARRAALHASPKQIAELDEILEQQQASVDRGELGVAEDTAFHYAIAKAADNTVLLKVVDVLMDLLKETRERALQVAGRQERSLAGHRRILAAVQQGDGAAAERAMLRHISEIEKMVLKQLL